MMYQRMPRVGFYCYAEWAYGTIHKALVKELYKNGIQADIIDWSRPYTREEFDSFIRVYDVIVCPADNAISTLINSFHVPPEKIVAIAHGRWDIQLALELNTDFSKLKAFGGVSNDLSRYAKSRGIDREMSVVQNGTSFDYFYRPVSDSLRVIGYAGQFSRDNKYDSIADWKRGVLVQEISRMTNTPVYLTPRRSHLTMPDFYGNVDCIMVSSTEHESCSLPLLEAASAGRLPISTPVGITCDVQNPPGYILPMDSSLFVNDGVSLINMLKSDSKEYRTKCIEAQEYAREYYDWSRVIESWIKLILE